MIPSSRSSSPSSIFTKNFPLDAELFMLDMFSKYSSALLVRLFRWIPSSQIEYYFQQISKNNLGKGPIKKNYQQKK